MWSLQRITSVNCKWMMLIFVFSTASHTTAGGSMGQFMSKMNKSPTKWINESTWKECFQLSSSISAFAGLCSNITVNSAFWSKFSASENPFTFLENSSVVTEGMIPYQLNRCNCHTVWSSVKQWCPSYHKTPLTVSFFNIPLFFLLHKLSYFMLNCPSTLLLCPFLENLLLISLT